MLHYIYKLCVTYEINFCYTKYPLSLSKEEVVELFLYLEHVPQQLYQTNKDKRLYNNLITF